MSLIKTSYEDLVDHFSKADIKIFEILEKVGPVDFPLITNPFQALVESILSQQVSTKSADSTISKVLAFRENYDNPEEWMGISTEKWREFGVSRQKASYLQSLSEFFVNHETKLSNLAEFSDEEIIELLIQIKGIGEWTAHMFLIFSLGRANVLAYGDLGVRRSMTQKVYQLDALPEKEEMIRVSKTWPPHLSWAQIYLWRYSRLKE